VDRDPLRIEVTREERRIDASRDVGDLRRGESDDLVFLAASVHDVEVVEVAPGRTRYQDPLAPHVYELCT
jgi:hypothetical protein